MVQIKQFRPLETDCTSLHFPANRLKKELIKNLSSNVHISMLPVEIHAGKLFFLAAYHTSLTSFSVLPGRYWGNGAIYSRNQDALGTVSVHGSDRI